MTRARWIAVAIVLLVAAGGYWLVMRGLRPVAQVMTATRETAVHAVPGSVEVRAAYVTSVRSAVPGRIIDSALEIGRYVRKGEVLAQLDTGDVALEIDRIGHEIAAARKRVDIGSTLRADVENARSNLEHLERQVQAGTYSPAELEKAKRSFAQLRQRQELDEVNLQLTLQDLEIAQRARARDLERMTITAPVDGVVSQVLARPGDLLASNAAIAVLISEERIVEAKVSEENMAAIRVGQRSSVRFLTHGLTQFDGEVAKVLPSADPDTQRYTVHLNVKMPPERPLIPGLTGEASILIDARPNAVVIPRRAVVGGQVLLVVEDRVVRRNVVVGYESLNNVEILEGVAPGDRVIVEEQDRFREGERVRTKAAE